MRNKGLDFIRVRIAKWILPTTHNVHKNPNTKGIKRPRTQKPQVQPALPMDA